MKRTVGDKLKIVDSSPVSIKEKGILNERERWKLETSLRKWEIIKEVKQLKQKGKNNSEIARSLHLGRPTVIKYLRITEPPVASRPCILDPFIPRIKELLLKGHNYTQIFAIIKQEGYTGQISLYNSKMKGIRWELKNHIRYLKRSELKKLLYQPLEKIKDVQKQKDLEIYLEEHPELKCVLELVSDFKTILLGKERNELKKWIKKAEAYEIPELKSFIKLIQSDLEAVKNAITYDYSNGLTEGNNNKIKVIKRQMYGRCKFDLLRLKILC